MILIKIRTKEREREREREREINEIDRYEPTKIVLCLRKRA